MSRLLRIFTARRRAVVAVGVAVLAASVAAWAYWAASGSGTASGSVGNLAAPTEVSASTSGNSSTVSVSWTASAPVNGLTPTGYYVKRWSGATPATGGGTCGTPAEPVNQTSCNDTGVADGTYTYTVVAVYRSWDAESAHSGSVTVVSDNVPPTTTIELSPATPNGSNGWYSTDPSFTLSASDSGSGVASTKYQIDGGATHTYNGSPVAIAEGQHTVSYWSVDNAGNTESTHTTGTIKVDTVAPTSSLSLGSSPTHALLAGSILYFNSAAGGSFKLVNTVADATSGPASATFPLVSATNWTHAAETVTTPSGGPFSSSTYSWTGGAGTPSGAQTSFTSADSAGNASVPSVLTFTPDATAPTGGVLNVNGTAASAGGSTSTSTSTGFAIGTRTDYSEAQSASQSGLASSILTIQSETLTANTCGLPGSGGPYASATTISGTNNPTIETGYCYVYTLNGTDNVGNAASVKTTVKVDTTGPSSPTVTLSGATTSTFISGTTVYINAQAGREGSFKATGASTDAETGVASIKLPSLPGFSEGGGTLSSPFETKYKWSGAVAASGAQSVTATNGAGLTATNSSAFTVAPDTTAPTGGALSVNGAVATGAGSASNATETGFAIESRTDYGETQTASASGLASSTLTIQSATLTGNTCGAPGSGGKYAAATTITGTAQPTIETGFCYVYTLTGTDNVGNAASVKTTVKVDTTGPSGPTVTLSGATTSTFISGTTVYINAQSGKEGSFKATGASTDTETGVTSIKLPALTGFTSGGGTLSSPFETTYKWSGAVGASGAQSVTATNGVGLTTTNSAAFTVTPDTTAPSSAGTVTVPARVHATAVSVTFSGATDAGSGISTTAGELLRAEANYAVGTDTCGSFGSFAKVGSAGPTSPATDATVANNKCYQYEYKASDNVGNTTTSGASGTVKVDTTAPKATTITAVNGGTTARKTDPGDVITYTFSENIDPASITSAWSVGSTPDQTVTMTFKDNGEGNGTNKPDFFEVTTAGVHLGTVVTGTGSAGGNWVPSKGGAYSFSSTMHFSTFEVKAGENVSRITITLNSLNTGGTTVGTESASETFKWTPDAAITDLAGNAADTATKAENKAEHF
jgi:hypothetical protein